MNDDMNAAFKQFSSGAKGNELSVLFRNSEWVPAKLVSRREASQSNIPVAIIQKSFSLPRPSSAKPGIAMVDLTNGNQAIVVVSAIKDVTKVDVAKNRAIREQLQKINTSTEYFGFEQYLKDNADISINLRKDTEEDI